ncbi:MAG: site-specific DNA-methyltransferase [Chloroflexaceae bacterium]|nr:site-specific DNA-methyltransferase [Chloroflexaceae bacterium]
MKDVFLNTNTVQQLRDSRVHSWYRFVLSYPDHVVTRMLDTMCIQAGNIVLDPFVGTGTTLIECKSAAFIRLV